MRNPRRICVVTGARSDYNFLQPVMVLLQADPDFELQLVVTGQHLTQDGRESLAEIRRDGFSIDAQVILDLTDDSAASTARALGQAIAGTADLLGDLKPDFLLFVGDRYEILGVAQASLLYGIPMGHIAGGDITEGAIDDTFRHCLTKLAHLHFVTNEESARRVRQMGEEPARVHVVGSTSLDRILSVSLMERTEFFSAVDLSSELKTLIVTFHPATQSEDSRSQCAAMLEALHDLGPNVNIIFTGVNADPGAHAIHSLIMDFCRDRANARHFLSLGALRYYSALRHGDAVVGNSSSGLYEAPSFRIPTVNIGDRQDGRLRAVSVIDCLPEREQISAALRRALSMDCSQVHNPYGEGGAASRILAVLKSQADYKTLLRKKFSMVEAAR